MALSLAEPALRLGNLAPRLRNPVLSVADPVLSLGNLALRLADLALRLANPALSLADPALSLADPALRPGNLGLSLQNPVISLGELVLRLADPVIRLGDPDGQVVSLERDPESPAVPRHRLRRPARLPLRLGRQPAQLAGGGEQREPHRSRNPRRRHATTRTMRRACGLRIPPANYACAASAS